MAFEYTHEQITQLLDNLRQPFALKDVQWRVTNKTQDRKSGMVAPYADPRAYAGRLNEVFGTEGWSCELKTETTIGLTRIRAGKAVPTGKVSVTATLEIFGIGKKASIGEMWADDDNAYTRAEASAKKRAASMFGLGEYFYSIKGILGNALWVPLDDRENPTRLPELPPWAVRPEEHHLLRASKNATQSQQRQRPAQTQQQQQPQQSQQGQKTLPVQGQVQSPPASKQNPRMSDDEQRFRVDFSEAESFLGSALANSVIATLTEKFNTGELRGNKGELALEKLRNTVDLLTKVRQTALEMHHTRLDAIFEHFKVENLNTIPSYHTLYYIAMAMDVVPRIERKAA